MKIIEGDGGGEEKMVMMMIWCSQCGSSTIFCLKRKLIDGCDAKMGIHQD
ncbi:hypothetical protein Sjap_025118 [Stephania japonica]|uniref:Uncharacterized protein n=1 Tax=Stephania japonica TaxID=461633 RepID=A0AAP0E5L1_9MAGN